MTALFYFATEAAERLGLKSKFKAQTILWWVRKGKLKPVGYVGKRPCFDDECLMRFVKNGKGR